MPAEKRIIYLTATATATATATVVEIDVVSDEWKIPRELPPKPSAPYLPSVLSLHQPWWSVTPISSVRTIPTAP